MARLACVISPSRPAITLAALQWPGQSAAMRMLALLLLWVVFLGGDADARALKLATWNLSWLTLRPAGGPDLPADTRPKRPEDIDTLRRYALALDADVIAFTEVDGPELAARVFPAERWHIHIIADSVVQRVGFAVRNDIAFHANPDLAALDVYAHARYHLRSGADITLDLPGGPLRLLAVHLKSGCRDEPLASPDNPACPTLGRQLVPLASWVAARAREHGAFALMGDFNRWMEGRDAFFAALQAAAPLRRTDAGRNTPCWGGAGFLDHILLGGDATAWLQPDSLRVLVYREKTAEMKERLSDHCPVSVRLDVPD